MFPRPSHQHQEFQNVRPNYSLASESHSYPFFNPLKSREKTRLLVIAATIVPIFDITGYNSSWSMFPWTGDCISAEVWSVLRRVIYNICHPYLLYIHVFLMFFCFFFQDELIFSWWPLGMSVLFIFFILYLKLDFSVEVWYLILQFHLY